MECRRAENLVDAYLDGELDPIHSMEVEGHLQECRKCTMILEGRKTLQEALRTSLPYYKAPPALRQKIQAAPRPVRNYTPYIMALAACLIVAIGQLVLPSINRTQIGGTSALADALETAHVRSLLMREHLMDVESSDKHTVKPWFNGKLPFAPPVNDFAAEGFPLVGGRLDVIDHQTVAALIYRRDKHLINVFLWPAKEGNIAPTAESTPRGYHIVHWTSDAAQSGGTPAAETMNYWAVSDVETRELITLANLIRGQATATAPTAK